MRKREPSLTFFFCILSMLIPFVFGIAVGIEAFGELLRDLTLWVR